MLDRDLDELYVIKVTKCDHKELEVTNCDIKLGGRLKKLVTNLSPQAKSLIISLKDAKMTASELQLVTNLSHPKATFENWRSQIATSNSVPDSFL